jgi:hypothetical protein
MRSEAKSYQFDHLPPIDYDAHPAYGRVLSMPQLGARLKAFLYFLFGFILIAARRIVDFEHLPQPSDGAGKLATVARQLPTYLRLIVLQRLSRLSAGEVFKAKSEQGKKVFEPLQRDGVSAIQLPPEKISEIRKLLAPQINILEQRLSPAGLSQHEPSQIWLDAEANPEIYQSLNQIASDTGIIEAASAYLKRPVGIGHVAAQINDPPANGVASPFADVGVAEAPCAQFHIDPSYNLAKLVIYLSDVHADTGPLTYVLGSNRASRGFWDGMIRRANDLAGLSSTAAADRELFYALPGGWQRKAAFGTDIPADGDYAKSIQDDQWQVTSSDGNAILYDPAGIHRDGVVRQGRRVSVVVKLTELPR